MAGPIKIAILANASQAKAELNSTAATAERISGKFSRMRLPAALALGAIAVGAKAAFDSASDLNEEVSKSQQIFGRQAKDIERFANSAAKNLGQSKREALGAASTFGLIGQKAGLGGAETVKFSKTFVGLASDLASFNNTSPEEAITAIGAAMRGESEPIRKYGVLLDDATLRNRALKLGLISTVKQALTPQQKALAASKEILAQTGKAQGDFSRTSKGAANASRINAAQAENLKAKLGQGLLPAYTKVLELANKFLTIMSEHPKATKIAIAAVAGLAAAVLIGSAAFKIYSAVQAVQAINTKRVAAGQKALNLTMLANPVVLIVAGIVALIAGFVILYKRSEKVREITDKVWAGIKKLGELIANVVIRYVRTLAQVWLTFGIVAVAALKGLLTAAFAVFGGILKAADKGLGWIPGIGGKIKTARKAFDDFGDGTIRVLDGVENKLKTARDRVGDLGRAHAKPTIDSSSIDRANAKMKTLIDRLNASSGGLLGLVLPGGPLTRTTTTSGRTVSGFDTTTSTATPQVISIRLSADQISQLQRGREIRADLDAWDALGARTSA